MRQGKGSVILQAMILMFALNSNRALSDSGRPIEQIIVF